VLLAANTGVAKTVSWRGHDEHSALDKRPVGGALTTDRTLSPRLLAEPRLLAVPRVRARALTEAGCCTDAHPAATTG